MTRRAIRQTLNVIGTNQLRSELFLIVRDVGHVEDLVARTNVLRRIAMAVETPLHRQRRGLKRERHLVDAAVAGRASDSLCHVNAVIEVHEIGQPMHARPNQRTAAGETGPHRLQHRGVRPDLRMAIHAGLGRRDAGEIRGLDRCVTVTAIDSQSGDVVLMAERDRLLPGDPLIGGVGRAHNAAEHPERESDNEHRSENGDARESVRAAVKNLRH